ncbi:MAG: hypothetical protein KGI06_04385 [Candidatus Micrarchaeota archaeon]|nr:hypothetical protein [Candidatus Micrarchaeota archaeon]
MDKYVITMLGEKDHGKSTLIGNLLIATGSTTQARISEVRKASRSKRFEPAHILDSFSEEREQEMTIDTTRAELVYRNAILELIDVPGHLELIKNMMSGASNSDIAVLMVSVKDDEGFRPQTKRHIFLSSMFGTKALIVAVNKMDYAKYDRKVFESAKGEISEYLGSIGFGRPVAYVPISAYNNENLVSKSGRMKWYKGKPMLELIRELAARHSRTGKKGKGLRVFVQDSMEIDGRESVFGIVYSGSMKSGDSIRIEPSGRTGTIKSIYVKGKKVRSAHAGTNVAIMFGGTTGIERGSVIYGKGEAPHRRGSFGAKMFLIKGLEGRKAGSGLSIRINSHELQLKGLKIKRVLSPISGSYSAPSPSKGVAANSVVYADVNLGKPYPVERFKEYGELGRFAIYRNEDFIGVGIVE